MEIRLKMKIGILNSGGDCPGINSAVNATARAIYEMLPSSEVIGIIGGFAGLMESNTATIKEGYNMYINTSRIGCEDITDAGIQAMKKSYDELGLDNLIVFGGDDTANTVCRMLNNGMKVIFVPKTIENNVFGTDFSLGFYSAVQNAASAVSNVKETARSHSKIMIAEIEGENGWLTLYSGVAGGADIILLPEVPYSYKNIFKVIEEREKRGLKYTVIAISDGAMTQEEYRMTEKDRTEKRKRDGESYISLHLASVIRDMTGKDAQAVIPSYILRGGEACSFDKLLAKRFAARAANLVRSGESGVAVVLKGTEIDTVNIFDITKHIKSVPFEDSMIATALNLGMNLGV